MNIIKLLSIEPNKGFILSLEIYIISIIVLILTFFLINMKLGKTDDTKYFKRFFLATIISVITDFMCYIFDLEANKDYRIYNIISNILYISISMILSYEWFNFAVNKMNLSIAKSKKINYILKIIVLVHILVVLISLKTHWMFYIDENGVYQRGSLFILQMVPWLLPFYIAVVAIIKFYSKKDISNRKIYVSVILYSCFPAMCEIFQIVGAGSPSISFGYTIGAVLMYVLLLEDSISSDQLTGLNNRQYMLKYLYTKLKNLPKTDDTYLFILDINSFKKINDKYGHVEGDKALILASEELKKLEYKYSCYVSRFGGDEFVFVIDNMNDEKCEALIKEINNNLMETCKALKLPYELSFSFGYHKCMQEHLKNVSELINIADSMLYVNKSKYKEALHKNK